MIICDADISPVTGTGKYYVGKHKGTDLQKYLKSKFKSANAQLDIRKKYKSHLFCAMRKYPCASDWRIHGVMPTLMDETLAYKWETELIALLRSRDREVGYNLSPGGEQPPDITGIKRSDATKAKHRAWHKAMSLRPDYTNPLVAWTMGNPTHQSTAGRVGASRLTKAQRSYAGQLGGRASVHNLRRSWTEDEKAVMSEKKKSWCASHPEEVAARVLEMKRARELKCVRGTGGRYATNK
jgi:hypothetical protein